MEGQSRSSTGVSQLESKIQDLEERLRYEERYRANSIFTADLTWFFYSTITAKRLQSFKNNAFII